MFSYNTEWINTSVQCTELIESATETKSGLDIKIVNLQQKLSNKIAKGPDLTTEYDSNQIQVNSVKSWVDSLPEGDLKDNNLKFLKRLEIRQITLGNQVENYDVVARLETQLDLAIATLIRDEVVAFIAAVEARKTALANG